jgi:hypothetical protein
MNQIDTSIYQNLQQPKFTDPMDAYQKMVTLQGLAQQRESNQLSIDKHRDDLATERTLAGIYKSAMNPDGSIDRQAVLRAAAGQNLGAKIPGLQKSFAETDKAAGEVKKTEAETGNINAQKAGRHQEVLYKSLKEVDSALASLVANPNATDRDVYGELGRLVRTGALNAAAEQSGKSPDDYAKEIVSTMPAGNPQALKQWLIQAGMRTTDGVKRLEMSLPKYNEQNRGGVLNEGAINQITGERTSGKNQTLTADPNAVLSAETQRRGQNMVDARSKQANDQQAAFQNSQVIETADGFALVDKRTGNAIPVNQQGVNPLGKNSEVAKNMKASERLAGSIPYARELLKDATSSRSGAVADSLMAQVGVATKSGDAAASLETLSGWMTSNVPRFEGPQSDKDVATYQAMAGMVGDRTKPTSVRLAALDTVEKLMKQYQVGPRKLPSTNPGTSAPAQPSSSTVTPPRATATPSAGGRPPLDSFQR